jgi:preprotein translocase subunit SecB
MTEPSPSPNGSAPDAAPSVTTRIIGQYLRDISFENMVAQKGLSGDTQQKIGMQTDLEFRRRGGENQYEVITKVRVTNTSVSSGETLFLLEIEYGGIFEVSGLPEDRLHRHLLVECPRLTFPFLRRIVAEVTQDGGFPPLVLDAIDFASIYRKELARRERSGLA